MDDILDLMKYDNVYHSKKKIVLERLSLGHKSYLVPKRSEVACQSKADRIGWVLAKK